ncbi:MAG: alpha/beta hydrolase [Bdellovibrionota bacterium]
MITKEFQIKLPKHGITLSVVHRPGRSPSPILALHGWLDNANSFELLARQMPDHDIYALDFAGHGNSQHLPTSTTYSMLEYVSHIHEVVNVMNWQQFNLLGHSLGACVASLYAGTFPGRISRLALLEGIGPLTREAQEVPEAFAKYIDKRISGHSKLPYYESKDSALAARIAAAKISSKGAALLVERGLIKKDAYYYWKTDPRLTLPSPHRLTESQVLAFLSQIKAPSILIKAEDGYLNERDTIAARCNAVKNLKVIELPGAHHLHFDIPEKIAAILSPFYNNTSTQ